ncbi:ATP-binding protein, partial [Bacteriovorax sp. DB6_IX]|uniref:sensor histidine kinase n=1 Tax=Bacteriovorax sp. DB6_IX TaxID=1353530 RepID=UPI001E46C58A
KSILIKYFMLLIATLLVLIGITEYFQYKSYLKYFQNNAIEKSEILASNLQATLLFESKKDFEDLTKNHEANGIIVVDTKKKLFAARGEFFDFQKINSDITWSDHYLITRTKIYSESEELGTLFVRYETSRIYTLIQAQLLYITLGVAALIISILVVLKVIDVQLTTPLKELSDFAKKLTQNDDISSRLQITERNLETKSLKDSFNCLLDNIEDNNKSLNDLNTNLEKKVSEKTIELQEAFDDLKKFQNQIVAQEKLASLGSLAAGIAHEIKNPINLINNSALIIDLFCNKNITNFKSKLESDSLSNDDIDKIFSDLQDIVTASRIISNNGKRADGIIKSMLLLSRSQQAVLAKSSFSEHLEQALNLSFHAMRAKPKSIDVNIIKNICETPEVPCFPQDLERAFVNILENSFYALKEKKKDDPNFNAELAVSLEVHNGFAHILIKDNGIGMSKETLTRILEPFYTTKPAGAGTGLGMSMVNDIITAHKGEMSLESSEGLFTKVKITLPLS